MIDDDNEDDLRQRIVITIDIPVRLGTDTVAVTALLDVLSHLEHDGIRPYRTVLEITDPPAT